MNTPITRARRRVIAAFGLVALLNLAACGGDGDAPLPDAAYVSWTGSANGVVILDWNNERFAVRADNGNVASYADDRVLTGLTVLGNSVFWNGTRIGDVTYTTATTGARIVDFTCLDGRDMDITVSGGGWSFRCA